MSFFDIFSTKKKKEDLDKKTSKISYTDDEDNTKYGINRLSKFDLERNNFTVNDLIELGWWPDKILEFAKIIRLAYIDLVHTHSKYATLFDVPIRNAVKYMKAQKIDNIRIKDFLELRDYDIPSAYWSYVIDEDNCYMYQIEGEERQRSPKENKHYRLRLAIEELINSGEYTDLLLKVYIALYNLKQAHALVDEFARKTLFNFLTKESIINFYYLIEGMPEEIFADISNCQDTDDDELLNKMHYFVDIVDYAKYKMLSFRNTFVNKNIDDINELLSYDNVRLIEINYVYKYFNGRLNSKQKQAMLFKSGSGFQTLFDIRKIKSRDRSLTPRYTRKTSGNLGEFIPEVKKEIQRKRGNSNPVKYTGRISSKNEEG